MSPKEQFSKLLEQHGARDCLVWRDRTWSFAEILSKRDECMAKWVPSIRSGAVVAIEGDFSPTAVSALLALMELGCLVVPMTPSVEAKKQEFHRTAQTEWIIRIDDSDELTLQPKGAPADHPLIHELRQRQHAGLILFTSGSTGTSKAVLHDLHLLLKKYLKPRHALRTIAFLLFDHIGGIDTLFYNLANGSCLVTVPDHAPETVAAAVERHQVEVLPVSPTFLNLMLLDGAHLRHDMRSLNYITYGAEVMPEFTLTRLASCFPHVRLLQKFGTTEVGTLRSQSRQSGSAWVRIGGEGYETRVVAGQLEIKADSAMLGYLNAPSPFTEDGWFKTGDAVEVDGEFMRILGRRSELINVGGEKVYPAEVEAVLMQMPGVTDAVVSGEPNPLTGNIVVARVNLASEEAPAAFRQRMRSFCQGKLAAYKVPARVQILDAVLHSARQKKMRLQTAE
jgi:long-chain acyl-CoA synthetase